MKHTEVIPYFAANNSFEIVYRNNSTSTPVKPHTHNALEIYFTLTNLPDVLLNDTVSDVERGSLIVIPPHCVHQLFNQKLTVYERYIITINSSWLASLLNEDSHIMSYAAFTSAPIVIRLSEPNITKLCATLNTYINTHSSTNGESVLAKYADFLTLLTLTDSLITEGIGRKSTDNITISQSQKRVNEIIAYINKHLTEELTMDIIADHFHLNKDYLGRLFKEHTHATIGHYLSVQRTGLAQNMLSEGHTVSEVQEALRFSSYSYFFNFFKKMTGISPSHYRAIATDKK